MKIGKCHFPARQDMSLPLFSKGGGGLLMLAVSSVMYGVN